MVRPKQDCPFAVLYGTILYCKNPVEIGRTKTESRLTEYSAFFSYEFYNLENSFDYFIIYLNE